MCASLVKILKKCCDSDLNCVGRKTNFDEMETDDEATAHPTTADTKSVKNPKCRHRNRNNLDVINENKPGKPLQPLPDVLRGTNFRNSRGTAASDCEFGGLLTWGVSPPRHKDSGYTSEPICYCYLCTFDDDQLGGNGSYGDLKVRCSRCDVPIRPPSYSEHHQNLNVRYQDTRFDHDKPKKSVCLQSVPPPPYSHDARQRRPLATTQGNANLTEHHWHHSSLCYMCDDRYGGVKAPPNRSIGHIGAIPSLTDWCLGRPCT